MPERIRCNLCGADDAAPLFRLRDYRLQVDDVEWTAVRCRRCGLGYLNPRPTREEARRYYPARYFEHRATAVDRYRRQAAYVPGRGRLLDIGTAGGEFLCVMRERGWEVAGIEPSAPNGNAHGLNIARVDFPEESGFEPESFDTITAWAVFEHLHDPYRAFDACMRLLRPEGRLVVQVPNLRSVWARWALQEDVPRHLYFFSESTLAAYATRAGLRVERVVHTTDLFGGSGRGVLRLLMLRALGEPLSRYFDMSRTPVGERFRQAPLFAILWSAVDAIERVVLPDWLVRWARMSGQIVVTFSKRAPDRGAGARPGVGAGAR